jgi:anti-sigma B factor antagonist
MTQPISVQVVTSPGHTEVRVGGEIDMLTAPRLGAYLTRAIDNDPRRLIVDLTDVSFIDSSGLHVLVRAANRIGTSAFGIITRRDNVLRVFSISGIDRIISIFASIDQAVAALNAEPSRVE